MKPEDLNRFKARTAYHSKHVRIENVGLKARLEVFELDAETGEVLSTVAIPPREWAEYAPTARTFLHVSLRDD